MPQQVYASLFSRAKAASIDGITLLVLIYLVSQVLSMFDSVPNNIRTILFILIFILYEPLLLSIFGATVGHFFSDILVKKDGQETKNINILSAVLRFALKISLGWISLIIVNGNDKKKAIHDFAANSVVVPYSSKK